MRQLVALLVLCCAVASAFVAPDAGHVAFVVEDTTTQNPFEAAGEEVAMPWTSPTLAGDLITDREDHTATMVEEKLYVFGGCSAPDMKCYNDLTVYDTKTGKFEKPLITGTAPTPRQGHTATYITANNIPQIVIFGGYNLETKEYNNELWVLALDKMEWHKLPPQGDVPTARESHTATVFGHEIYYFGGYTDTDYMNDMYVLDGKTFTFTRVQTKGEAPVAREGHSATKVGMRVLVFGGFDGQACHNDLFAFDTRSLEWSMPDTAGDAPEPREDHTSTLVENKLYVVGGCQYPERTCHKEVYELDIISMTWAKATTTGKPPMSREGHTTNVIGSKLFVMGGCLLDADCFDDAFELDVMPCPHDCSGHGECTFGECVCSEGFKGRDCSEKLAEDEEPPVQEGVPEAPKTSDAAPPADSGATSPAAEAEGEKSAAEPEAEGEAAAAPEGEKTAAEPEAEGEAAAAPEGEAAAEAESAPEGEAEAEAESAPEGEAEAEAESAPEGEAEAESAPEGEAEAESEPEAEAEAEAESEPEAEAAAEEEAAPAEEEEEKKEEDDSAAKAEEDKAEEEKKAEEEAKEKEEEEAKEKEEEAAKEEEEAAADASKTEEDKEEAKPEDDKEEEEDDATSAAERGAGCTNSCSGHGTCVNGKCQCESNYSGPDCSKSNLKFQIPRPVIVALCVIGGLLVVAAIIGIVIRLFVDTHTKEEAKKKEKERRARQRF